MVRIHPDPPSVQEAGVEACSARGCSSVGRAPALQAGGHRFDPVHLHQRWWEGARGPVVREERASAVRGPGTSHRGWLLRGTGGVPGRGCRWCIG
jgi:hypothetical protein